MTIDETFRALRGRGELALIPYLTAGFPTLAASLDALRTVVDSGADVIELGIPFSDPIADGPTIQHSSQAALDAGARLAVLLEKLASVRVAAPLVFMSYLNPLLALGRQRLLAAMNAARVSGLIIPDLPVEEAGEWRAATSAAGMGLILLAAPTSPDDRLARIAEMSDGFIYCVSLAGTTGTRAALSSGLPGFLARVRRVTDKPLAVGFGVSTPEHVRSLRGLADGAVVGSRLVEAIRGNEDLGRLVRALKDATRS